MKLVVIKQQLPQGTFEYMTNESIKELKEFEDLRKALEISFNDKFTSDSDDKLKRIRDIIEEDDQ